jgi:hypothetical protein
MDEKILGQLKIQNKLLVSISRALNWLLALTLIGVILTVLF